MNQRLIVHGGYHKVMTVYFHKSFMEIADALGLKYQMCKQHEMDPDTDIFFEHHSRIDFSQLREYVGSHISRDPRDVVVSGYFYHLWCKEDWCHDKSKFNGMSYQEKLNALPKEDGIIFEIERGSRTTLRSMSEWDYDNDRILEIRYEDLVSPQYEDTIRAMFTHYGFTGSDLEKCVAVMKGHSLMSQPDRKPGEEKARSHLRKGLPGDWKNHFTDRHKQVMKEKWGDLLVRLGYEPDHNW